MNATDTRRIWIGCLAAYNAGSLHGEWVDVNGDAEELEEAKDRILAASPEPNAEEWFIAGRVGFGDLIGEYSSMEEVARVDAALAEAAEYVPLDAVIGYLDHVGGIDYLDGCEDAYSGCWRSGEEYAADLIEQTGGLDEMPDNLRSYFDYAALYRDMRLGGEVFEVDAGGGEVFIFRSY